MKYCANCGTELVDEAVICVNCGAPTAEYQEQAEEKPSTLTTLAKAFMIIGTVVLSLCGLLIPLAWCLPMTLSYFKKLEKHEPIGTGFKICSLFFVSTIAGIFMLIDNKQ